MPSIQDRMFRAARLDPQLYEEVLLLLLVIVSFAGTPHV